MNVVHKVVLVVLATVYDKYDSQYLINYNSYV